MKTKLNFELDMKIDESSLDIEWLEQPGLAYKYGKYWADCELAVGQAEENVKLVRSELVKEANDDPDECLGEGMKPTALNVEAYYRNHKRHIQAKEELNEAIYQRNIAEIAKKEITITRKNALENLVRLFGLNYFSGPSVPRNLPELVEMRQKQTAEKTAEHNRKIGNKLKRTQK